MERSMEAVEPLSARPRRTYPHIDLIGLEPAQLGLSIVEELGSRRWALDM